MPVGEVPWDIGGIHSMAFCLRNVPEAWGRPPPKGRILLVEPHCSPNGKGSRGISKDKAETHRRQRVMLRDLEAVQGVPGTLMWCRSWRWAAEGRLR